MKIIIPAVAGAFAGIIAAGALPEDMQVLPRIVAISGAIGLLIWRSRIAGDPLRPGPPPVLVALIGAALAVVGLVLAVAGAPRAVWLGGPGLAAMVVLLGSAFLAARPARLSSSRM